MKLSRERYAPALLLGSVLMIVILIAIVLLSSGSRALRYSVVFREGKSLAVGDRVQLNGIDIGEVDRVELSRSGEQVTVGLKIAGKHREKVKADSTAIIRNSTLVNMSGQKIVEVINSSSGEGAMPPGSVVQGKDGGLQLWAWQGREKLARLSFDIGEAARELGEGASNIAENLRENAENFILSSEQVKSVLEKIMAFVTELAEKGLSGALNLMQRWEDIKAEIGPVLQRLRESGREVFMEQIERIVREIEEQLRGLGLGFQAPQNEQESAGEVIDI